MKLTFLHLSDLHYRLQWEEEVELVITALKDDIGSQLKNYANNYLVFSGDHVQAGGEANLYREFEQSFGKTFESLGLNRDKRICVPGNHDISRTALKDSVFIQKGALAETTSETLFNDRLDHLSKVVFKSTFGNYVEFEARFSQFNCCQSSLGGSGWDLGQNVGVYCLNTALCSYGGLSDQSGQPIDDKNHLMIDTRGLYRWLSDTSYPTRILVMHHPPDWLMNWSKAELEATIAKDFQLVLLGHTHEPLASYSGLGTNGTVRCIAPPLFTRKSEVLGYSFVTIDSSNNSVEVDYRQWSLSHRTFVAGSVLAGNDLGKISFNNSKRISVPVEVLPPQNYKSDTLAILQAELDQARTCYSSKRKFWVARDLANFPEMESKRAELVMIKPEEIADSFCDCIIRAPQEFGLTCIGHFIAVEFYRKSVAKRCLIILDLKQVPHHRQGLVAFIELRCKQLQIDNQSIAGLILDNWTGEKSANKILKIIRHEYQNLPVAILEGFDDSGQISTPVSIENAEAYKRYFLWSLSKARIRELVADFISGNDNLDDDAVTQKVVSDIDALNIHRTPLNCLLILKLVEHAFDDSPVNRTEMIGRVLNILFYSFVKIPTYATKPDLKDCEYALGYFSEWLFRNSKSSFLKREFDEKVRDYCKTQLLELDIDVLFNFLLSEGIFVRKGLEYEYRFNYWLVYFAAHRMHHDSSFCDFILSDRRYAACPEIVEFYAGIDRRRTDAVIRLTNDLKTMNEDFLSRTGIPAEFNPLQDFQWNPDEKVLERLRAEVNSSVEESALPAVVKDAIADRHYDRSKPYDQQLAKFIGESTLRQMIHAMKGAARVLRNSDHVLPSEKIKLLNEVMCCWSRVAQILMMISPVLAIKKRADFEDMNYYLENDFDKYKTEEHRWQALMVNIPYNIVNWYQEDVFSKKLAVLLTTFINDHKGELGELLLLMVMIKQKPPGWNTRVEEAIVRSENSFYLSRIFSSLRGEYALGFSAEKIKQQLRHLSAMALAKYEVKVKRPNSTLIEKVAKFLDEKEAEAKPKGES